MLLCFAAAPDTSSSNQRLDLRKWCALYLCGWVRFSFLLIKGIAHVSHRSAFTDDFGPKFTGMDPTGEQRLSGMIMPVEKVRKYLIYRKRAIFTNLLRFRVSDNLLE